MAAHFGLEEDDRESFREKTNPTDLDASRTSPSPSLFENLAPPGPNEPIDRRLVMYFDESLPLLPEIARKTAQTPEERRRAGKEPDRWSERERNAWAMP